MPCGPHQTFVPGSSCERLYNSCPHHNVTERLWDPLLFNPHTKSQEHLHLVTAAASCWAHTFLFLQKLYFSEKSQSSIWRWLKVFPVSCSGRRDVMKKTEYHSDAPIDEVCDVLRIYVSTQPCILGAQRQVWRDGVSRCCSSAAQNWNLATLCKSSPKPVWTIKKQKENSASETHFTSFLCSQKVFKLSLCVFHVWNRGETKFDFIFLLFETERQKIKVEDNQSKMFLFCEDNNQSCCSGNIFAAEWSFY